MKRWSKVTPRSSPDGRPPARLGDGLLVHLADEHDERRSG
jgi:hypothetical protein